MLAICGGIAGAVAILPIAIFRCKPICWKWDSGEHLARILAAAGVITAFLGGNAVIHHGHYQLCIPFQTDNGELPQAHIQPPVLSAEHQFFIEYIQNSSGNLYQTALPALADLPHPRGQHHGIQHLYRGHQIGIDEF